jgi:hypothetical protein
MTVRLSLIPGWVPNLFTLAPNQTVSRFYIPVPVRLPGGEIWAFGARQTASLAGVKGLFMKILGQNGCFFKLHDIWYSTMT